MAEEVERVSWAEFLRGFRWLQGEHISAVGATGSGKTTVVNELLPLRDYVAVFATKPRDPMLRELRPHGYRVIREWPPGPSDSRVILWPRIDEMSDAEGQRETFDSAMRAIYRTGGWCVYFDELPYLSGYLGLDSNLKLLWQQGRSLKISVVASMQRPREVPLLAYSMATHLLFFRASDDADIKRIGEIGSLNSRAIRETVLRLAGPAEQGFPRDSQREFLYVNTRSGRMLVSRVER